VCERERERERKEIEIVKLRFVNGWKKKRIKNRNT